MSAARAESGYQTLAAAAAAQKNLDEYEANAARRAETVDAAGVFVREYHTAMAANSRGATAILGLPRSTYETQVWTAAADWSEAMRVARNDYELAVRRTGHQHLVDLNAANTSLAATVAALNVSYADSAGAATAQHDTARAAADAALYATSAGLDAEYAEQEVLTRVQYDNAQAAAQVNLQSRLSTINEVYYAAIVDPCAQYYLDATSDWTPFVWSPPIDSNQYPATRPLSLSPPIGDMLQPVDGPWFHVRRICAAWHVRAKTCLGSSGWAEDWGDGPGFAGWAGDPATAGDSTVGAAICRMRKRPSRRSSPTRAFTR